ncbi:MAG: aminoacyl-histidine dipeptidase [Myxococcota bacterium]
MDALLSDLQPRELWRHFLELSKIPRGSKQEGPAAQWVADTGRALGCEVLRDSVGNVLLRKAASPGLEDRPGVALQAHVDMVCEKNEGTQHDFTRDPLQVWRDGDVLRARGTTLGADNGIGVAAALAVLSTPGLRHPPLEVLVTIDEETGMTGARELQPGWLRSKYLLNLDSEEEGDLTIGCAGGVDTVATRKVAFRSGDPGRIAWRIKVFGCKGGHSGIDISAGRANANRVLAQVLAELNASCGLELASVHGGNKRNALAREASAVVRAGAPCETKLRAEIARLQAEFRAAFGAFDPGISLALEPAQADRVLPAADARALVGLLLAGPHGVEAFSPDIAGLPQTSTNMGLVETHADRVEVCFLTRSSVDSSKSALAQRIALVCQLAGFTPEHSGGYPGWKPEPNSDVVRLVNAVHQDVFGKPMAIKAIHAGLECGLLGEKLPDCQMASIGPNMWDVHTPDEHVSIPSVAEFWRLLTAVLERV